jgi:23S rRNA pseudouridine955/2504/2580 synthase
VEQWVVTAEYSGQRIDNFLLARLKGVPKTRIYKMLRTGEVRVNGGRVSSDYRIEADDRLRIPPVRLAQGVAGDGNAQAAGVRSPAMAKSISASIQVLLEDDWVLGINKPFGLAVHGGSGVKLGVIEALRQNRFPATNPSDHRPQPGFLELVHRLDRETSGVMLIAKRRSSLTEFHRQLREGQMRKRYLALVWGSWPAALDRIDAPLHKWVNAKGERWVRVQEDGQAAITKVKALQRVKHPVLGDVSLMLCEPITGRTHQLRVHLASQGFPIIGDPKYGRHEHDDQFGPRGSEPSGRWLSRMFLHAWQLRCQHPHTGERLDLQAAPDAAFAAAFAALSLDPP